MRNRLIYAAVGVVGVLLIGLSIASATVWRADDVLRASATADQAIVLTDPGVLEMAGDPMTATATVPAGGHVVLAIGRETDVAGWVGTDPHQRVAGLAGWHGLALAAPSASSGPSASTAPSARPTTATSAAAPPASAAPTPVPTPSGSAAAGGSAPAAAKVPDAAASDMWVAVAQGTGTATLTWKAQPGRWSLLVVGSSAGGAGAKPTLSLAWPRTVTTPYLVPGSVAGGLLVLASLLLFWRDLRHRHDSGEWTPVLTDALPVVGGVAQPALTRRQIREMQELARTGQLPVVPTHTPTGEVSAVPSSPAPVGPASPRTAVPAGPAVAAAWAARGAPTTPATGPVPRDDAMAPAAGAGHGAAPAGQRTPDEPAVRPAGRPAADEPVGTPAAVAGARTPDESAAAVAGAHTPDEPATPGDVPLAAPAAVGRRARWRASADAPPVASTEPAPDVTEPAPDADAPPAEASHEAEQPARPPVPGGRRARRQSAAASAVAEPESSDAADDAAAPEAAHPASSSAGPPPAGASAPATSSPTWMPRRFAQPAPAATPVPAASEPAATAAAGPPAPAAPEPTVAAPGPAQTAPAPTAPAPNGASPAAHGAGPGAQPAWLSRVAARWEREDATADVDDAVEDHPAAAAEPPPASSEEAEPPARVTPGPRPSQEASRADAWRKAWGLPPLDNEEEDR